MNTDHIGTGSSPIFSDSTGHGVNTEKLGLFGVRFIVELTKDSRTIS
jgi:hypothetical protein